MTVEIIYETHATTLNNEQGLAIGWLPGHLSETGRKQAKELGERRWHDDMAMRELSGRLALRMVGRCSGMCLWCPRCNRFTQGP